MYEYNFKDLTRELHIKILKVNSTTVSTDEWVLTLKKWVLIWTQSVIQRVGLEETDLFLCSEDIFPHAWGKMNSITFGDHC